MDSFRVARVGTLLFAMFSVGWAAVISRDPTALASEMWPVGLAVAAVFTARRRQVPLVLGLVLVLAIFTFLLGGRPLGLAIGGGIGVALEALVIAWILTHGGRVAPALRDDSELSRYIVAIGVGGCVAAVVSVAALALSGGGTLWLIGLGTLVGHSSSALFLLPFFMRTDEHQAVAGGFERGAQWVAAVAVCTGVFLVDDVPALLFMLIPVLGWSALRGPLREVQGQLLMVATIGTFLTTFGFGPLAEAPARYALAADLNGIVLQTFFIDCALVVFPLSLAVGRQIENARQARVERDTVAQIVRSANVAIIGTDEIGRVTSFNPAAERLLGYRPEEVFGQFTTIFHTGAEVTRLAEELGVSDDFTHVALALAGPETGAVDVKFLLKDGSQQTHAMTLSRIVDDRGDVTGYVSTSEDITERVQAHDALFEALEAERRAVERLKEVDQVKDTFVSAVSHELRTPITSIVGYLEMLEDGTYGDLNRAQVDAVTRVNNNSQRLLGLIDELLTLSRIQDAGLGMVDREVDLVRVVRTACDVVAPAWSDRRLEVTIDLPADEVAFLGDQDMLERVVVNLVGNAVKFTPDGGRVVVSLRVEGNDPVIEVSDTGIGIPVDEQDRLFTRFFRSSNAQEHAIPGSGLGLAIARHIVDMHGGSIAVESEPGVGTAFRVVLPRTF